MVGSWWLVVVVVVVGRGGDGGGGGDGDGDGARCWWSRWRAAVVVVVVVVAHGERQRNLHCDHKDDEQESNLQRGGVVWCDTSLRYVSVAWLPVGSNQIRSNQIGLGWIDSDRVRSSGRDVWGM